MKAYLEGKPIQFRDYGDDQWEYIEHEPLWAFKELEYRIGPTVHPRDLPENVIAKIVGCSNSISIGNFVIRVGDKLVGIGGGKTGMWSNVNSLDPTFQCIIVTDTIAIKNKST
jgi:hypothetical protein